jgi:hypothetical protein
MWETNHNSVSPSGTSGLRGSESQACAVYRAKSELLTGVTMSTTSFVMWYCVVWMLPPSSGWRWKQQYPSKHQYIRVSTKLHGIAPHKIVIFITAYTRNLGTEQVGAGVVALRHLYLGGTMFESLQGTDYFDWDVSWFSLSPSGIVTTTSCQILSSSWIIHQYDVI